MNKLNILLLVLVSVSAFAVVTVQDQSRLHFIALDKAQKQEIKLDQDYARLKLDQARLANHKLIKQYPTGGKQYFLTAQYVTGKETYLPSDGERKLMDFLKNTI